MSYRHLLRQTQSDSTTTANPNTTKRAPSNASTASSAYSNSSSVYELSRTSTLSSTTSSGYGSHRKGLGEATGMYSSSENRSGKGSIESSPDSAYKNVRKSLRPLAQPPGPTSPERDKTPVQHNRGKSVDMIRNNFQPHSRTQSVDVQKASIKQHNRGKSIDVSKLTLFESPLQSPITPAISPTRSPTRRQPIVRPNSMLLSRSDSISIGGGALSKLGPLHPHTPLTRPELQSFERSSTSQLRTLSKFAQTATPDDFTITSPEQEVAGLHGRRRLQRSAISKDRNGTLSKPTGGYGWEGRNWMDKQRQFLQAYEYLCHIGEAKEWIEDILKREIPPTVQLEQTLRDGVTLAEVVEALYPERRIRIFRNPKLQARHWDNIAQFFRFLDEVQLPELFRFELIDLYEKKNIPKVIYCIHALSWLLFRKGIVDFRIGNLVGQLEFEDHELEEMQKGLDKAGISMPSFGNMGADFGVPEPEPEPEPVETEDERIDRELGENEAIIVELQAQLRGACMRMHLGRTMQVLWDTEDWLVDLQSMIRGDFTRQIVEYRLNMKRFAVNLQRHARGFLVRKRQSNQETFWKSHEEDVQKIQSLFRAKKVGQQVRDEVGMMRSTLQQSEFVVKDFQSSIRGFLARKVLVAQQKETESVTVSTPVLNLQAAVRGMLVRKKMMEQGEEISSITVSAPVSDLQAAVRGMLVRKKIMEQGGEMSSIAVSAPVSGLQAAVRGMLVRKKMVAQDKETSSVAVSTPVLNLQAAMRGMLLRKNIAEDQEDLYREEPSITAIQGFARALLTRNQISEQQEALHACTPIWEKLQAIARAGTLRNEVLDTQEALKSHSESISNLQAFLRAGAVRREVNETLSGLDEEELPILELQSLIRGMLLRRSVEDDFDALIAEVSAITDLQSMVRAGMVRQKTEMILDDLQANEEEIIQLQALSRAVLLRNDIEGVLGELESEEDDIVAIQSAAKASLVRAAFLEKQRFFKENMEKVVKIQSFVRGRLQGEAYKSLTTGKNPPVNTVKNFVHLLNDSDFDFNEEIEFERMRKTVVQQVRQNEMAEQYIDQLDIKIALLVKNKITLDEVVKHQRNFGGHSGNLLVNTSMASGNQFDLKALNKNSRKKLELYQQLFFNLQTQPQYLARLFQRIREQGTAEKDCKRIETLMMGLFGYAQKRREEYYLLKLIARSAREEIEHFASLQDFLRGNFFWTKLLANYTRSPRDRKFLRDLLGPLIMENIIEDPALDLESDPMQIYRSAINNEELRTGRPSQRALEIPRDQAIKDPETRDMFIDHLRDLREISDLFMLALESLLHRMPYGVRFICQQIFDGLCQQFPRESQRNLLQLVGNWLFRFYLYPALTTPESMGVVERQLTPLQKRNLGEVAKVLGQISTGRLFGGENMFLQPLNAYVTDAIERITDIFSNIISVSDAESTFDIDEFNDLYARTKPTLYIKMADIFAIHNLICDDLPQICPNRDDVLREIIQELGSAKSNESEMLGVSSAEIQMTLTPKLHDMEDPEAEVKALFMETKRCILYIIRVQSGPNLMEILVRPISPEDDQKWHDLLREEFSADSKTRGAYSDANTLTDIKSMSYWELKRTALENIMRLEQLGRISRQNYYQDILNAIAVDIRTKSRRRVQRQRELEGVRMTLGNLGEKAEWLESQRKSYDNYIEQAMMTLQKKGKKRFLMPFSKQYNHEKELERTGRTYKFGSFKYSARTLSDKGVLVAWKGYPEREWDKINLTISCDQVGVFSIEGSKGSIVITGAVAQVPMDSLLAAQFANHQYMDMFEGAMRLNVNLFLHLLYRKFYRTE
ncbi:d340dd4f-b262-4694-b4a3-7b45ecfabd8e [Sclerotinia trifoliorum]|uniref:D340dd4f-b262-4694-b4a3-7b45ecfabd8e n=1 Tax=Sclerotinia trifoliorum TaxID=28548 RepID=A0A8H2ZKQ0_9HELO|nr:d340dd4f-b262-4694-b4a3-7b45ecfabd8e [Sclerotinia trifoliorum]